ncbi:MAG TPA: FUSC family protein [Streptosporangiaceae bacterium]|nr:FUSC family protein [Streptosporangiaceae bacterium]
MLESWRTTLLASDPGWQRARQGARAALTVAGAFFAADGVARLTGQSIAIALLAAVVGMLTTVAVNDPTPRQRAVTMALVPAAAVPVMLLGAALGGEQWAADAVFVVVLALVTYVRRFGPRAMALGMVSYMAYFFTLFLGAKPDQLPWLAVSALIGVAVAALMRFAIIRDSTAHEGDRARRMLFGRLSRLLDAASSLLELAGNDGSQGGRPRRSRQLRRRVRRRAGDLNEACLIVEAQLEDGAGGPAGADGDPRQAQARQWVFDIELAGEYVAFVVTGSARDHAAGAGGPPDVTSALVSRIQGAARSLRQGNVPAAERQDEAPPGSLAGALRYLGETARRVPVPFPDLAPVGRPPGRLTSASTTRPAVQVTVAASLAIAAGTFVSPTRWFWAVIAAFTVFSNTTTAGATIYRAGQRVIGTAAGVAAGLVVAAALAGHTTIELVLLFGCVFGAFYYVQTAYGVMTLFITLMLSLLYALLGEFSFSLLSLRLEETGIGALIGAVVALLVLPQRGRQPVTDRLVTVLNEMAALLDVVATAPAAGAVETDRRTATLDHVRRLDQAYQQLRTLTAPAITLPGAQNRRARQTLLTVGVLAYRARMISGLATQGDWSAEAGPVARYAREVAAALLEPNRPGQPDRALDDLVRGTMVPDGERPETSIRQQLEVITLAIARLAAA